MATIDELLNQVRTEFNAQQALLSTATSERDTARAQLSIAQANLETVTAERDQLRIALAECEGTDPEPPANMLDANRGVWALQQVSSSAQLSNLRSRISQAVGTAGVTGFSLRVPWSVVDSSFTLLNEGRALADKFAPRVMAGKHTPLAKMGKTIVSGGVTFPSPYTNTDFLRHYGDLIDRLATWCVANDVTLLHCSWYAKEWAELYRGPEVQADATSWLNGHKALIDAAIEAADGRVILEWPLSGHGPVQGLVDDLADHIVLRFGPNSPNAIVQGNGWDATRVWGAPTTTTEQQMDAAVLTKAVTFGVQSIRGVAQTGDNLDWNRGFPYARSKKAATAELYVDNLLDPAQRPAILAQLRPGEV
jgi:hypothetical protein